MTLIEQLKAIRALIDKPEKWTQVARARDKDGVSTSVYDPSAVCYCLEGADAVIRPEGGLTYRALASALPDSFSTLSSFNDRADTTHDDVMALVDRAIEAEQAA